MTTDRGPRTPAEFTALVERISGLRSWQFSVIRPEGFDPGRLRLCIVFIHAAWSGPSVLALQALGRVLVEQGERAPRLVVLDIDAFAPEAALAWFGEVAQGWGETYWIRDGVILHRLARYVKPYEVEGFVRQLATAR